MHSGIAMTCAAHAAAPTEAPTTNVLRVLRGLCMAPESGEQRTTTVTNVVHLQLRCWGLRFMVYDLLVTVRSLDHVDFGDIPNTRIDPIRQHLLPD